jgi:hypothetical protein
LPRPRANDRTADRSVTCLPDGLADSPRRARTRPTRSSSDTARSDTTDDCPVMILVFGGSQRPTGFVKWGGWGSNPRPADYEKYGLVHRTHYLHGYNGAVPLMALMAPFAQVARSINRSTPYHGDHRMPATERYRRQGLTCQGYGH